jgi:hypothetical protein
MANPSEDLFSTFLDPYLQRIEERERAMPVQQKIANAIAAFESQWHRAYRDNDAVQITERLIGLVDGIEQRFWDFEIPMLLQDQNSQEFSISHNVAVAALIYACKRDRAKIESGLSKALALPNDIGFRHSRIYDHLASFVRPPLTPPATEEQLASVLGVSRHTINNQWRRGEWETFGPKGSRRWGYKDRNRQSGVLQAYRNKFPEKFWLDVRKPSATNA